MRSELHWKDGSGSMPDLQPPSDGAQYLEVHIEPRRVIATHRSIMPEPVTYRAVRWFVRIGEVDGAHFVYQEIDAPQAPVDHVFRTVLTFEVTDGQWAALRNGEVTVEDLLQDM